MSASPDFSQDRAIQLVHMVHPEYLCTCHRFRLITRRSDLSYASLYIGIDLEKDSPVLIKQLNASDLNHRRLVQFTREIHALAICISPFINSLVGYTTAGQFWIIVQYYEKGTLTRFLESAPESVVTPLFYCKLVWAISTAMATIHSHKIIHRDLKAANIWIDDSLMPKLTDFWNSRPIVADRPMTKRIGTINVMAPEVMMSHVYDEAADVFSFGVLVYFMCEQKQPFANYSDAQIVKAYTQNDERPQFSSRTPESIREVIARCWAKDPAARPSFETISSALSRGKVRFPGVQSRELIETIQSLSDSDEAMVSISPSLDGKLVALRDPEDPKFGEVLENCVTDISPIKFESFFGAIAIHFQGQNFKLIEQLLNTLHRMTLRGSKFVDAICRTEFYELPVLKEQQFQGKILQFLAQLISERPSQIRAFMKPILRTFLLRCTYPMVKLLWKFVVRIAEIDHPLPFIDIYLESVSHILRDVQAARDFLRIIYHLSVNVPSFKESRFPIVRRLLNQYLSSSSGQILVETWRMIAHVYDTEFALPAEFVSIHIHQPQLVNLIISVYLRMPWYPPHRPVIEAWLSQANSYRRVPNILFRLASQQLEVGTLLLANPHWISQGIGRPLDTLRLVIILLQFPQLRQAIGCIPDVAVLFTRVLALRTEAVLGYLSSVFRYISVWPLLSALDQAGFVAKFIQFGFELRTEKAIDAVLLFIDAAARIGFSNTYLDLCPKLWQMIVDGGGKALTALHLLVLFSRHQQCLPILRDPSVVDYFTRVADCEGYRDLALVFLRNVAVTEE